MVKVKVFLAPGRTVPSSGHGTGSRPRTKSESAVRVREREVFLLPERNTVVRVTRTRTPDSV